MRSPSDWRALVGDYLAMMAAERGAARNTLDAYRRDLDDYGTFLGEADTDPLDATSDHIRRYLSDLERRGFRPASSARRLAAVRQFHRFLYSEGRRRDDPGVLLVGPRRRRTLPKTLDLGEVDRLLAVARERLDSTRPPMDQLRAARTFCLIEVLYATGLRVSELISLPRS